MYTIEKNVPLPQRARPNVLASVCGQMEVGDSFKFDKKWRPNLTAIAAKQGRKFAVSPEGTGWRVWRTA